MTKTNQPVADHEATTKPIAAAADKLNRRGIIKLSVLFGALNILIHIPFLFRYDLYFQSGIAVEALKCKRIWLGDFSVYTWATDYGGVSPLEFLFTVLFGVFGFSVTLASALGLVVWSLGVGFLVGYVAACFGKRAAIGAGWALAVGVPFFLMYSTQYFGATYDHLPLSIGLFFWLAVLAVRRGPQSRLPILAGLLMGWWWYMFKQVLIVWVSILVVMLIVPEGRGYLSKFLRSRMAIFAAIAFLVGYSPELLYKAGFFDHEGRKSDATGFFGFASPSLMARNWYMMFRCIPAYFNADPWSRAPEGTHYLNHMENWESFPLDASDTVGIVAAFLVIGYTLQMLRRSYREKNLEVLLLAIIPVVNVIMIITAAKADGSYYTIRRYLLPSGIVFMVWLGIRLSRDWEARRWTTAVVLGLTLLISAVHQLQLLQTPDELADYKKTVQEIEKSGYRYGISWYSYSHTLTALSAERVVFGVLDHSIQNPYQKSVLEQDVMAVVWPAVSPPPFEFAQKLFFGSVRFKDDTVKVTPERWTILGQEYQRVAEPRFNGELGWAPYRRASAAR